MFDAPTPVRLLTVNQTEAKQPAMTGPHAVMGGIRRMPVIRISSAYASNRARWRSVFLDEIA
jgi:hypothetical protein